MQNNSMWSELHTLYRRMGQKYVPVMNEAAAGAGLSERYGWLLAALVFDPEPVSAALLRRRYPYTSPRAFNRQLRQGAQLGFLEETGSIPGEYCMTASGRQAAGSILEAAYAKMALLEFLPPAELERLSQLLHLLVMACLSAPEPPWKWSLLLSRRLDSGETASPTVLVDQYLTDLGAYRDDAHLSSWQHLEIEGNAWEALTLIWRGQASTLDDIVRLLKVRGWTRGEHRKALDGLVRDGWLKEDDEGAYGLTDLGLEVRTAAESATEQAFWVPFACLSPQEHDDLGGLLGRAACSLQEASAAAAQV
jgi:hypothetical protein